MVVKLGIFGRDEVTRFVFTKYVKSLESDYSFETFNCIDIPFKALKQLGCNLIIVDYLSIDHKLLSFLQFCGAEMPKVKVLILLNSKFDQEVFHKLSSQSFFYFDKSLPGSEFELLFMELIRNIDSLNSLVNNYRNTMVQKSKKLSKRESQIANLLTSGLKNSEIAEALKLSSSTVSTYRRRIYKKLKIDNIIQLNSVIKEARLVSSY